MQIPRMVHLNLNKVGLVSLDLIELPAWVSDSLRSRRARKGNFVESKAKCESCNLWEANRRHGYSRGGNYKLRLGSRIYEIVRDRSIIDDAAV